MGGRRLGPGSTSAVDYVQGWTSATVDYMWTGFWRTVFVGGQKWFVMGEVD